MPIATGNSSAPNEYEFMKYRGPTGSSSDLNSGAYPSYGEMEFGSGSVGGGGGGGNKGAFEPSYMNYEQPSSWLHGTDFNSMAGDLFSSKNLVGAESSFGNLSLNLDQIKIVKNYTKIGFLKIFCRVIKRWKMF
jgi:hypothetical protein